MLENHLECVILGPEEDTIVCTGPLLDIFTEQNVRQCIDHHTESTHSCDNSKAQQVFGLIFRGEEIRSCDSVSHTANATDLRVLSVRTPFVTRVWK